jgi:hypothetical protein
MCCWRSVTNRTELETGLERGEHFMPETYSESIDLASLERNWPEPHAVPPAILGFAKLIRDWPYEALGIFSIQSTRMDDYYIELGADLNEQFGKFLHFSDGTYIALWFHDGVVENAEPVVELGSEGDLKVLAPNLKSLFTTWANGPFHRELELTEEERTPENIAQRERYGKKLLEFARALPEHPPGVPAPNLEQLMENQSKFALKRFAADPTMQAITKLMDAHFHWGESFWTLEFQIKVAGSRIEILGPALAETDYKTRMHIPELEALIPLVLKAREESVAPPFQARGLWHIGTLVLHIFPAEFDQRGHAYIKAAWDEEPKFASGGRLTKAQLNADLERFPRSPRWMELWMNELE